MEVFSRALSQLTSARLVCRWCSKSQRRPITHSAQETNSRVGPCNFDIAWQINVSESGNDFHKYRAGEKSRKKKKIEPASKQPRAQMGTAAHACQFTQHMQTDPTQFETFKVPYCSRPHASSPARAWLITSLFALIINAELSSGWYKFCRRHRKRFF